MDLSNSLSELPRSTGKYGCPVRRTSEILDGKWTTRIIRELLYGTRRFSELQRGLPGISPKMLTGRLKMLQANGLVDKTIYPCIPPKTEYNLTKLGKELEKVILAMAYCGELLIENDLSNSSEE